MALYDIDTFVRANNASSWGTATGSPFSSTYTNVTPGTNVFAISSNTGTVTGDSTVACKALLGSHTLQDGTFRVRGKATALGSWLGMTCRYVDASNRYILYADGTNLVLAKVVSGTSTTLVTVAGAYTVNTYYFVKASLQGSTIRGKIWQDGTAEPATWTISTTDTGVSAAGQYGLFVSPSTNTDTVTFNFFEAETFHIIITDGYAGLFR